LCRCDVQRRCACGNHSGHRESHSGVGRKSFAFPSESLFAFSPESCSPSPRNAFRVHPGILFVFARNPQPGDVPLVRSSDEGGTRPEARVWEVGDLWDAYSLIGRCDRQARAGTLEPSSRWSVPNRAAPRKAYIDCVARAGQEVPPNEGLAGADHCFPPSSSELR
jgi:hypothetical protein